MENESQPLLLPEVGLWPRPEVKETEGKPPARVKAIQRNQLLLRPLDVEQLVAPGHPARALWKLLGQCDLQRFYEPIEAVECSRPAV